MVSILSSKVVKIFAIKKKSKLQVTTLGGDTDDVTVAVVSSSSGENSSGENEADGSAEEESTAIELVHVSEDYYYMAHVMRIAAALHSIISFAMLIAYYHLKVLVWLLCTQKYIVEYEVE